MWLTEGPWAPGRPESPLSPLNPLTPWGAKDSWDMCGLSSVLSWPSTKISQNLRYYIRGFLQEGQVNQSSLYLLKLRAFPCLLWNPCSPESGGSHRRLEAEGYSRVVTSQPYSRDSQGSIICVRTKILPLLWKPTDLLDSLANNMNSSNQDSFQWKLCDQYICSNTCERRERQMKNKYNRVRSASSSFLEARWTTCMMFMRRWTATSSITLLLHKSCFCLCEFVARVQLQMFLAWWWTYSFTIESRQTRHTTIPLREERKTSMLKTQLSPVVFSSCWTVKHYFVGFRKSTLHM